MVMNAFVLFKLHDASNAKKLPKDFSSLDFVELWLKDVDDMQDAEDVPSSCSDDDFEQPCTTYKQHRRKFWASEDGQAIRFRRNQRCQHNLLDARHEYRTEELGKRNDLRRICIWCGTRTFTFCQTCMVPVCIGLCNQSFHSKPTLPRY